MSTAFDIVVAGSTPVPAVEVALAVRRTLATLGHEAAIVEDQLPTRRPDRVPITIAPHLVYPHLSTTPAALAEHLSTAILISTARPSEPAWEMSLGFARGALAVMDVSDAGVSGFAAEGLAVRRFRLGYDAAIDHSVGGVATRPIDVVFLGTATPRRLRLLAEAAQHLSLYSTDLRLTEAVASRLEPVDGFISGERKWDLLGRTKIALNLHPADDPLFEWSRAQEALSNGCLLVSELSSGATPLDPGRHFVSVDHRHLGPTIDRLLSEPDRLEEIRAGGAAFYRDSVRLEDSVRDLLELAQNAPRGSRQRREPPVVILPPTATPDPDDQPQPDALQTAVMRQNAVLKRLFIEIRGLRRELAYVRHSVEEPGAPLVRTRTTPGWAGSEADVSVIVSLYNYERFVRAAVDSALASEGIEVEVIVIDDRSTDEGPQVVRTLMDERPDAAIMLLEQRVNTGVQRARNLAFSHARAPFAFVLDADNLVFPRGLEKLRDALERDAAAAFSYGIIERFGDAGSLGLMGVDGWDEHRLARSHYIDAMALVRLDAWREVGGYVTDPALELGWEDYDLWLNFASHGYHGVHVREIIGRYRVHGISSLAITTLDTDDLIGRLQARHARFFNSARGDASSGGVDAGISTGSALGSQDSGEAP